MQKVRDGVGWSESLMETEAVGSNMIENHNTAQEDVACRRNAVTEGSSYVGLQIPTCAESTEWIRLSGIEMGCDCRDLCLCNANKEIN